MGLCMCIGACVCWAVTLAMSYVSYNHIQELENSCNNEMCDTDKK